MESFRSLYIHIPFCLSRCAYCDFNSYSGLEWLIPRYVSSLKKELLLWSELDLWPKGEGKVSTVYFGGGTPVLLGAESTAAVLDCCRDRFKVANDAEVTVEANPGVVDEETLRRLRRAGVNRLSLGVQSFDDGELRLLSRSHSVEDARSALSMARRAGFNNVSVDLMYGLPEQRLEVWQYTLEEVLALGPEHLSLYALTLEENTPLWRAVAVGQVPSPDPDLAADMYSLAELLLGRAGYCHYEISNWARPGRECRHNLTYWRNQRYLGVGAGAHSYLASYRFANVSSPERYVRCLESGEKVASQGLGEGVPGGEVWEKLIGSRLPVESLEHIEEKTAMGETMMLGLRLEEGVSAADFQRRFGKGLAEVYGQPIEELQRVGLLATDGDRVSLTPRGRLLGNEVFRRFML